MRDPACKAKAGKRFDAGTPVSAAAPFVHAAGITPERARHPAPKVGAAVYAE